MPLIVQAVSASVESTTISREVSVCKPAPKENTETTAITSVQHALVAALTVSGKPLMNVPNAKMTGQMTIFSNFRKQNVF